MPDPAAAAVTPGMPNLPATMDNFDAIVNSYNDAPPPSEAPAGGEQSSGDEGWELPPQPGKPKQAEPEAAELEAEAGEEFEEPEAELEPEAPPVPDELELAGKAKEWLDAKELPEEFYAKEGVATVDGEEHRITVREAFDGYQRRAITTQRQQEAAATKNYYEQLISGFRYQQAQWKQDVSGKTLLEHLEDMDLGAQAEGLARIVFQRFAQEQQILDSITNPQLREMTARQFEEARQAKREARARAREVQRAQQLAQQNNIDAREQAIIQRTNNQLAQLAPRAFKEVGMKITPYTKYLLGRELKVIHKWGSDLTYDLVLEAAKTAKDVHDAEGARAVQKQSAAKPRPKLPKTPSKNANPSPNAPRRAPSKGPARVSDMDKLLAEYDRGL